jgi:hypothetical protein
MINEYSMPFVGQSPDISGEFEEGRLDGEESGEMPEFWW